MNEKPIPQALREQADALEKLAQRIAKESKEFSDAEDRRAGEKSRTPCLRFSQNSAMTTSGLRTPCGTRNFQARFNYLA